MIKLSDINEHEHRLWTDAFVAAMGRDEVSVFGTMSSAAQAADTAVERYRERLDDKPNRKDGGS